MDFLSGLLSLQDLLDRDKIKKFADSLPTAEQNLNSIRQGATGLLGKVAGGFNKMADQASQEGANIRDQIMQRYNQFMTPPPPQAQNPMGGYRGPYDAPEPETPRYVAPDNSGEMWTKEQILAYYDALQKQFDKKPAPSRAAWRKRQVGLLGSD